MQVVLHYWCPEKRGDWFLNIYHALSKVTKAVGGLFQRQGNHVCMNKERESGMLEKQMTVSQDRFFACLLPQTVIT